MKKTIAEGEFSGRSLGGIMVTRSRQIELEVRIQRSEYQ